MQMKTIGELQKEYLSKIDRIDFDLIVAHVLKKSREFVLAHPEYSISKTQNAKLEANLQRKLRHEPIAYILGRKEFFGIDFKVTPATLIPRPETELLVSQALQEVQDTINKKQTTTIIDIGTGSGNIIISIAKSLDNFGFRPPAGGSDFGFYGLDISKEALKVAKQNAKQNSVSEKIKFIHSDLLNSFLKNSKNCKLKNKKIIIIANLPYLSKKIYNATLPNVKKYEPRSALYSPEEGLSHYEKLLAQIQQLKTDCRMLHVACYMEISPEQKIKLANIIKTYFPNSKIEFKKDLAQKWRMCRIEI